MVGLSMGLEKLNEEFEFYAFMMCMGLTLVANKFPWNVVKVLGRARI